jgi:hypothetical protein
VFIASSFDIRWQSSQDRLSVNVRKNLLIPGEVQFVRVAAGAHKAPNVPQPSAQVRQSERLLPIQQEK